MAWTIDYTDDAINQLRKLDKQSARRIVEYMDERIAGAANPRSFGKPLSGPLGQFWRYRVGDFRIICDIEDEVLRVLVVRIGDRKDVYRKAKR
ncbi:addiction module toxin, RelE/StbE family [Parvibaculum lavamentivorans DS-1]|uniref:Addiction module toxin, RelE/StbE family n=1 Tax=Parvibaculum lavamentivorans (strain DS-1 / DSM 13023 / NCIMB 13966) TaxID=402881 RepID=A7HTK3_PARL1|nr:type II toxin-antitoxin system RelE/ParE family toxin [Parvibaculum lavamentivorans]ABS63236.1 addiction module toxin, RelE/StbE family [Parvibaculum lavamentivorans DS-1]